MKVPARVAAVLATSAGLAQAQFCPVYPLNGSDLDGWVASATLFKPPGADSPRLFMSGNFRRGFPDQYLLQWKDGDWAAVDGRPAVAGRLAATTNGQESALFVAGSFGDAVWRYDGSSWSTFPSPVNPYSFDQITAVAVFDADGPGPLPPRLHVLLEHYQDFIGGGSWWGSVAVWDGSWTWIAHNVPSGDLTVMAPASQPEQLFVTGTRGSTSHNTGWVESAVQSYDGQNWTTIGTINNRDNLTDSGRVLGVYDRGDGTPLLVVGGRFSQMTFNGTTLPTTNIAAWDGTQWTALHDGLPGGSVRALATFDFDGAGPLEPVLLAGGDFRKAAGAPADGLAMWDGEAWKPFPGSAQGAFHLIQPFHDDAPGAEGPALLVAGSEILAERTAPHITTWHTDGWRNLLDGPGGPVLTLAVLNEGGSERLIAGGRFRLCGELEANNIARWDGQSWSTLGTGIEPVPANMTPIVVSSAVHDDGSGSALYVGGLFRSAGGVPVINMARYAQGAWHAVGDGLGGGAPRALAVHDDGTGKRLYAGGAFHSSGWTPIKGLAVWDGTAWSEVAGGIDSGTVWALESWNSGSGPALYVGGTLMSVAGLEANLGFRLADGTWESLPDIRRPAAGDEGRINAFAVHDDGFGNRIYAIGRHQKGLVARLEMDGWHGLSSPFTTTPQDEAFAGRSIHDCGGRALHVQGARYTRQGGRLMPSRPDGTVRAISPVFNDGNGDAFYMAGHFTSVFVPITPGSQASSSRAASHIARAPLHECYANCTGNTVPPLLTVDDFVCFIDRFTEAQALPVAQQIEHYANCDGSTTEPVLTVFDFLCFIDRFAAGCP